MASALCVLLFWGKCDASERTLPLQEALAADMLYKLHCVCPTDPQSLRSWLRTQHHECLTRDRLWQV